MSSKTRASSKKAAKIRCSDCDKVIPAKDQALFVEEEVGRYFCSEPCIVSHFTGEIESLEREYGKHVQAHDLSSEERERYAHFRWTALEKPDEVWMEKTSKGDHRYTLIAEYKPEQKTVWAVACCLMLRGEPSFLYLAFVTSDRYLVDCFRKGDSMKIVRENSLNDRSQSSTDANLSERMSGADRLAEDWTESDSVRASIIKGRKQNDIPVEDFGFYQKCLEETLQHPNELWSYVPKAAKKTYHFIKHYDHDQSFWYVVIAKDTTDETQIEIIDVFPTRDENLIQLCRHGKKEVLGNGDNSEVQDSMIPEKVRRNVH
jgi:hypothetical protein